MSLAGNRRRLARLEARARGGGTGPLRVSGTAAEVREIDRHIARLDTEIAESERLMGPEELEESRRRQAEWEADFEARAAGLDLDGRIALLDADIAENEAEIAAIEAAEGEGGGR